MPKNHRIHSRPKQLPQTAAMSPPHTYTSLGAALGSNTSLTLPQDDQDEDDICPVCESECTCDNRPRHISINTTNTTAPSHTYHAVGSLPAASPNKESPQSTTTPSLKIKLTLPPSFHARASANRAGSKLDPNYNPKTKKSKRPADAISASGSAVEQPKQIGSPFSPLGQPLRSGAVTNGSQLNADGTLPKKRGRPPKAVAIAKEAARASGAEPPSGGIDQSNVGSSRQPAHASKAALPKKANSKVKAVKKAKAPVVRKVAPQKTTASVADASSSELTDPDDDNDDVQSIQFPTFMTAVSISSNESSASSSDADSDSDIEAEEERYILAEDAHAREKARLRKELMGESDQAPHRKWGVRNNWEIRPRRKSVGAEGGSDVGMDTDSGEETEEEEEEGEEEEADAEDEDELDPGVASDVRYVGVATGWSDEDEESSFDADLFFANLNDSSGSDDDIEHADQDEDSDSELGALSITEAAAAGFLAPFEELGRQGVENLPFDVTEGWDGQFTFTNGLKEGQGILDFDFEISAAQLIVDGMPTVPGLEDADIIMATSEEEEAMETIENDEDIDYTYDDSDGDTTEDEFVELDGVPTPRNAIQLRFPATLGSIDPLSTLSPVVSPGPTSRTLSAFSELSMSVKESPKPADILAGKVFKRERSTSPCSPAPRAAGDNSARSSPNASAKMPKMGDFTSVNTDQVKKVIVNESSGIIPCPFPVIRRLRRSGSCASKRSGSGSDIGTFGSGRSRPSSLLGSTRSPYQSMSADDFMVPSSPDFPPTEPIELHDVLESSFLEAEPLDVQTTELDLNADGTDLELHRHLQNLSRWDRIPLDTFRRTRMAGGTAGLEANNTAPHGSYRTPKPADGFSYGSSVGGMMRGSPLSATLWQSQSPPRNKKDGRSNYSVLLSPVILPVRDGEQTPTNNQGQNIHHHLFGHSPNSKSRKEMRKEKKRNRKMMNAANAHHHRQHYPNAKKRSTGSMQRSNFSSSPMPALSI